jgi:zinc protease
MESIRNHLESGRHSDLESVSSIASAIQQVHQFHGGIDRWDAWVSRYTSITAEDVRGAVNRWLVAPSHATIDVRPQSAVHPETPQPDRATPPPFQPGAPYRPPEIQTAKLPNGLEIFVLERHGLPKVAVQLQFRSGVLQSPPGKPAVMLLAAAAIRGTTTRTHEEIQREFDDLGAGIHGHADLNSTDFSVEVLRKNLDPALRLMADMLLHPAYPDWAVEAYKKDWIHEIEQPEANLDNFARPLYAAAFGPSHPLGRGLGNADSLRSLTTADVRIFHDRFWKPNAAALVFAGDIALKDAVAIATETLGAWTGSAPVPSPDPPTASTKDRIVFVDRKGVTQTMVVQVLSAVPRDHADYPAFALANRIYGGMSGNRIWENIRQQRGIAYYASSELATFPGAGLWTIVSPVQQDSTALAMREFEKELAAFGSTRPVTQVELDQAKTGIIRGLPEQFETVGSSAGAIAWNWAQGLPLNELGAFSERVSAVTLEQVNAVARKYARPGDAFFLLVGDREKIAPQLRDFR